MLPYDLPGDYCQVHACVEKYAPLPIRLTDALISLNAALVKPSRPHSLVPHVSRVRCDDVSRRHQVFGRVRSRRLLPTLRQRDVHRHVFKLD